MYFRHHTSTIGTIPSHGGCGRNITGSRLTIRKQALTIIIIFYELTESGQIEPLAAIPARSSTTPGLTSGENGGETATESNATRDSRPTNRSKAAVFVEVPNSCSLIVNKLQTAGSIPSTASRCDPTGHRVGLVRKCCGRRRLNPDRRPDSETIPRADVPEAI